MQFDLNKTKYKIGHLNVHQWDFNQNIKRCKYLLHLFQTFGTVKFLTTNNPFFLVKF